MVEVENNNAQVFKLHGILYIIYIKVGLFPSCKIAIVNQPFHKCCPTPMTPILTCYLILVVFWYLRYLLYLTSFRNSTIQKCYFVFSILILFQRIQQMLQSRNYWVIKYVPRKSNRVTDIIIKISFEYAGDLRCD